MKSRVYGKALSAVSVSAALLMVGCGNMKTDPAEEYKDVRSTAVPPGDHKPVVQTAEVAGVFVVDTENQKLVFTEGTTKSYTLKPAVNMAGVSFRLVAKDLPEGSNAPTLSEVSGTNPPQYILTWTPERGAGDQTISVEFEILGAKLEATKRDLEMLDKVAVLDLDVEKDTTTPTISAPTARLSATDGETIQFSIVVTDPTANKDTPPEITVSDESLATSSNNRESKFIPGARYVFINQKPTVDGSKFTYQGFFTPMNVVMPGNAPEGVATFTVRAWSVVTNQPSAHKAVSVVVKRKSGGQ